MLGAVGILLNLDTTFLGLTILAVGNALPDALTTLTLVKQGFGTMAISGGYAGQLFGLLVGFGLSMLKTTIKEGAQDFSLFKYENLDKNILDILCLGTAFFVLVLTFVWGIVNKFRMTKCFGWILITVYFVFVLACTCVAVNDSYKTF